MKFCTLLFAPGFRLVWVSNHYYFAKVQFMWNTGSRNSIQGQTGALYYERKCINTHKVTLFT